MKKPKWRFNLYKTKWTWKPYFYKNSLIWKDKWDIPRIEITPTIRFQWFYWDFVFTQGSDKEWEFYIWCTKYCNNDVQKAVDTWPWGQNINGKWVRSNPLK